MILGYIGLGNIGYNMAHNLLKAGYDLIVFDRNKEKTLDLNQKGGKVAKDIVEVATLADIIFTCLTPIEATLEVYIGENGLISRSKNHAILVDHSTIDVSTCLKCYEEAKRQGKYFLNAPVSGGAQGAKDATLTIMAGGEFEAYKKLLPIFEAVGKKIHYAGDKAAGTILKMVIQHLIVSHTSVYAENVFFMKKLGIDPAAVSDIISSSLGQSRVIDRNLPIYETKEFKTSGSPIYNFIKDLNIINDVIDELGINCPIFDEAKTIFFKMKESGYADEDFSCLPFYFEKGLNNKK